MVDIKDCKFYFYLDKVEQEKATNWINEQTRLLAEEQSKDPKLVKYHEEILDGIPYVGAIGGLFSFTFVPNSIGCTIVVTNVLTKESINVTNYDCW